MHVTLRQVRLLAFFTFRLELHPDYENYIFCCRIFLEVLVSKNKKRKKVKEISRLKDQKFVRFANDAEFYQAVEKERMAKIPRRRFR